MERWCTTAAFLAVASCSPHRDGGDDDGPPSSESSGTIDEPTPYEPPPADDDPTPRSLDAVSEALAPSLRALMGLNPGPTYDLYVELLANADTDECPTFHRVEEWEPPDPRPTEWEGECVSEQGTRFFGSGAVFELFEPTQGAIMWVYGSIRDERSGEFVEGGGILERTRTVAEAETRYDLYVVGMFRDSSGATALSRSELKLDLRIVAWDPGDGDARSLLANGSAEGLEGTFPTVHFVEFRLPPELLEGVCDEPNGIVALRDRDGQWYEVHFAGPGLDESSPTDCDGCGEVFHRGRRLGEVCPDWTSVLSWEEPLW